MKILVLNCGSSSVKYTFFDLDNKKQLASGVIECIGLPEAYFKHQIEGEKAVKLGCFFVRFATTSPPSAPEIGEAAWTAI